MTGRYMASESEGLDQKLEQALQAIASDVRGLLGRNLIALVLGGGYGRGEGGVCRKSGEACLYNDLDLFLVVRCPWSVDRSGMDRLRRRWEEALGVKIDFSRPYSLRAIARWPRALMFKELVEGHRVVFGPQDVLSAHAPAALRDALPLIEADRLMLNRGAGLLWAMRVADGCEVAPDPDFVIRNYFKCLLGIGDALLIVHGAHETPYRFREARLGEVIQKTPGGHPFISLDDYRTALTFKRSPDEFLKKKFGKDELTDLGRRWTAALRHIRSVRAAGPSSDTRGTLADLLRNLRSGRWSARDPRPLMLERLPELLAGGPDGFGSAWKHGSGLWIERWNAAH